MLLRFFQIQHCARVKTEVGRRLVNSACFKFRALLFNMISWSYIVGKSQGDIQGVKHDLRQIVKTRVLRITCIFGFMNCWRVWKLGQMGKCPGQAKLERYLANGQRWNSNIFRALRGCVYLLDQFLLYVDLILTVDFLCNLNIFIFLEDFAVLNDNGSLKKIQ